MSSLVVAVQPRPRGAVLEVSLASGGALGHFDPTTAQLFVIDPQDSLAVAAAVAPYLLGGDQPLGVLSARHIAAADVLWGILEASPFTWHRYVPLHDRLLLFYCPLAHLALEIVDEGEFAADVDAPSFAQLPVSLAAVPLRELEQHPGAVASWLSALCTRRADSRPGTAPDAEMHRSMWMRLTRLTEKRANFPLF
ncbi:MAG TPA: hypothetical protein VIJ96_12455 [Acidothermaceae bacterium]